MTLNEICLNDLPDYLLPSLAAAWPNDWVYYVFMPAINKDDGSAYRCTNGHEFGNAVLGRIPAASYQGVNAWGGVYTSQNSTNEGRTFACAYAVGDHFACDIGFVSTNTYGLTYTDHDGFLVQLTMP